MNLRFSGLPYSRRAPAQCQPPSVRRSVPFELKAIDRPGKGRGPTNRFQFARGCRGGARQKQLVLSVRVIAILDSQSKLENMNA